MKDTERQAINNLNNLLQNRTAWDDFGQQIKSNVDILANGLNSLDQEVRQKTFEVQNREQLLVQRDNLLVQKESVINQKTAEVQNAKQVLAQKEQKVGELQEKEFVRGKEELIDILPKLYPNMYSSEYEQWPNDWGKTVIDEKDIESIGQHLPTFKMQLLKNELIDVLPKLYPNLYPVDFKDWPNDWGRTVIVNNDFKSIENHLPKFKAELFSQKENLLTTKDQEIAKIKELLSIKELEAQNKDQLLLAKELEKQELARQKEIEKEELLAQQELEKKELLAQKEVELANKSLVKNQVIDELQDNIGLKEKEALNLKIESLMKQLAFKEKEVELKTKESELKDKALEDAHEIVKQNKIINELQEKLLAFQNLSKHDETLQLELSVIHFKVEESIVNGNLDEMKELSKYLSQLMKDPIEKEESLEISELLNNLSPVLHVQENHVQNPLAVVNNGNFDIDNQHITHSVLLNGEGSSFSIIQEESFH